MDLKQFITETISGIVEATSELRATFESKGVIVNPPASVGEPGLFQMGSPTHTYRRVEVVEFDVAVSASSETGGGGKMGLKILSVEAGAEGKHGSRSEHVSRVRFSVPIALEPSSAEAANIAERDREYHRPTHKDYDPFEQ